MRDNREKNNVIEYLIIQNRVQVNAFFFYNYFEEGFRYFFTPFYENIFLVLFFLSVVNVRCNASKVAKIKKERWTCY